MIALLNFLVLQWFGVRLCRRYMDAHGLMFEDCRIGDRVGATYSDGRFAKWRIVAQDDGCHVRLMQYGCLRWIWPMTGWWSEYRWIARRS